MWNPVPQTWIKAIHSNFFATWPGLTAKLVQEYLRENTETTKGHMCSNRANLQSTKLLSNQEYHEMTTSKVRHHELFIKTVELSGKIYSDQTGRFHLTSSKGNKYFMVLYDHDSNVILAKPLKSRWRNIFLQPLQKCTFFSRAGHPSKKSILWTMNAHQR